MNNLPLKKHETLVALQRLLADPVFQWVLAEQERLSTVRVLQSAVPQSVADMIEREQNFGRLAKIGELRTWMVTTIEVLSEQLKQENQ